MTVFAEICRWVSIFAFLGYGMACLVSDALVTEFERYGLPRFRMLIGFLEIVGALGLLVGLFVPVVTAPAAAGLSFLMLGGVMTRIRIRDSLLLMLPAIVLMLMNGVVLVDSLQNPTEQAAINSPPEPESAPSP
ncbi:MAG: DoxX family protein [Planctomycetota bacterium]|nr:DoxX family protein [Planctomycetota bacterium]